MQPALSLRRANSGGDYRTRCGRFRLRSTKGGWRVMYWNRDLGGSLLEEGDLRRQFFSTRREAAQALALHLHLTGDDAPPEIEPAPVKRLQAGVYLLPQLRLNRRRGWSLPHNCVFISRGRDGWYLQPYHSTELAERRLAQRPFASLRAARQAVALSLARQPWPADAR